MSDVRGDVTALLHAHGRGEEGALDRVVDLVYDDLRRIAMRQLRQPAGLTLDATGLVHEAYMKLVDQARVSWEDRGHFFGIAAHAMRQILVDHARRRLAKKRGEGQHHTALKDEHAVLDGQVEKILAIHRAMERLGELDGRLVKVVECRYFAGLTDDETAAALGASRRTVQRDWKRAQIWLREELAGR